MQKEGFKLKQGFKFISIHNKNEADDLGDKEIGIFLTKNIKSISADNLSEVTGGFLFRNFKSTLKKEIKRKLAEKLNKSQ